MGRTLKSEFKELTASVHRKGRGWPWSCVAMLAMMLCTVNVMESPCQDNSVTNKAFQRTSPAQPATTPQAEGDLYALVVGVSKYNLPKLNLKLSDNDAKEFARFLETQKKVFRNTHVKILLNEDATKQAIEKYLHYELPRAGKDDTVIIFLSGHGSDDYMKPNDYFFLGYDADPDFLAATAVQMNGLNFLKGTDSKRVLVIADACHSGAMSDSKIRTRSLDKSLNQFMNQFKSSRGRAILTSSRAGELSQERTNLPNGVFTYFLLKGLKGEADSKREGVVHLAEAYQYVYDRVKDLTDGAQHPQLESSIEGRFPVSVAEQLNDSLRMEVSFIAQDPRCKNPRCTDPTPDVTTCDDPLCGDVPLRKGDTMYSGQNYQIAVKPLETCYVYVYQVGNKGGIFRLFPGKDLLAKDNPLENPIKGGTTCWLPGKNNWLRQDNTIGEEKIYVVASRSRNQVLEDLYANLEKLRNQGASAQETKDAQDKVNAYIDTTMMPTRTLPGKVPGSAAAQEDPKIRTFDDVARILEAPGLDAVEYVSFTHKAR